MNCSLFYLHLCKYRWISLINFHCYFFNFRKTLTARITSFLIPLRNILHILSMLSIYTLVRHKAWAVGEPVVILMVVLDLYGTIRYSVAEQPDIPAKYFFKKIGVSIQPTAIVLSSIDVHFLPNFRLDVMLNVNVFIIPCLSLRVKCAMHFSCCCFWYSSSFMLSVLYSLGLLFCSASRHGSESSLRIREFIRSKLFFYPWSEKAFAKCW